MLRICMYLQLISWMFAKDIYDITKGACPVKMTSVPISTKNIALIAERCSLQPWEMCAGFCCIEIDPGNLDCFNYDQNSIKTSEINDNAKFYKRIPRCNQKSSCGPNEICKDLNYITNNKSRQHCICRKHTCGQNCEIENFLEIIDGDVHGHDMADFILSGNIKIGIETCKDLCMAEKKCKSFVYLNAHSKCHLKSVNEDTAQLRTYDGSTYGRRTCKCEKNENC